MFGFQKVFLEPGQSVELYFAALPKVFHLVDNQVRVHRVLEVLNSTLAENKTEKGRQKD